MKRKLKKELIPFMEIKLKEDNVSYNIIETENEEYVYFDTFISGNKFHEYVVAAMCEKQRNGKRTPVISYEQLKKRGLPKDKRCFIALAKDKNRISDYLGA